MSSLQTLAPQSRDLGGGFMVRRMLPSANRRAIGPFVFFDHFGPVTAEPGTNHDVRPHPHIGLATVTYLFEGAMMHRDSTGVVQRIEPGAVNWMTAGRGIVHSERTPKDLLSGPRRTHGLQLWVALPTEHEADAPSFQHAAAADIPEVALGGVGLRVLVGSAFGVTSPVRTLSPVTYVVFDFASASGHTLALPRLDGEAALYGIDEGFELDGEYVEPNTMVVLDTSPGSANPATGYALAPATIHAPRGGRVAWIGGAPLGPRVVVWNFVATDKARILEAEADWLAQRFDKVPGETEFIPLPTKRP